MQLLRSALHHHVDAIVQERQDNKSYRVIGLRVPTFKTFLNTECYCGKSSALMFSKLVEAPGGVKEVCVPSH